ncbi:DUF417 family protein [Mucilaginibacter sabulilitoris]|uniref:DUF417 family protein n=1 Tax=Mucilaginibacter sabulilitoris TaxID=1173583 RepID=A0ABZ0TVX9_9SPHI|nr:DUF417 family protein [Mucilaginibacter sabulilitoris]WPU96921.1 DUF417 family protein [Mucilaginibacter sabulilitoris]
MKLIRLSKAIADLNLPFILCSFGISVILLWIGSFKFEAVEANGVAILVTNSPLVSWDYSLFGVRLGAGFIGTTEIIAALLIIIGNFQPKLGMIGALMAVVIFFVTSTFVLSTPGSVHLINGFPRLSDLGSFLFKDITAMGASFYIFTYFGKKAEKTVSKSL